MFWRSSEFSIRESVRNAMRIATEQGFSSIAFPLIGAGSGGGNVEQIERFITSEIDSIPFEGEIRIVRYKPDANKAQSPRA